MKAHLVTDQAKWQAAVAAVTQSEAELGRATAQRGFREKQYRRIKSCSNSIPSTNGLSTKKQSEMEAAQAAERAAAAAIVNGQSRRRVRGGESRGRQIRTSWPPRPRCRCRKRPSGRPRPFAEYEKIRLTV